MDFFQKSKEIGKVILLTYIINNFSLPICYKLYGAQEGLKNSKIQEIMETDKYGDKFSGTKALDFLKLSHAITLKNIMPCNEQWPTDNENLENGVGDCFHIARSTYSNYLYLIDQQNKGDLDDEVRLSFGEISTKSGSGGPCWLEIKNLNGEWEEYETTAIDLPKEININPNLVDRLISNDDVLDLERINYNGVMYSTLDVLGALKSKGLVYHIYSSIKHQI